MLKYRNIYSRDIFYISNSIFDVVRTKCREGLCAKNAARNTSREGNIHLNNLSPIRGLKTVFVIVALLVRSFFDICIKYRH